MIAGCTGVEAVIRGLFGVIPGRDGSVSFAHNHKADDGPYTLVYPLRGRSWTVTQSDQGLAVRTDSDLDLQLTRKGGTVRIVIDRRRIVIHADAREDGAGKLILGTPGILKNLGAARPELLEVRVNGAKSVRPDPRSLIVDFSSPALDVEITVAPAA